MSESVGMTGKKELSWGITLKVKSVPKDQVTAIAAVSQLLVETIKWTSSKTFGNINYLHIQIYQHMAQASRYWNLNCSKTSEQQQHT